MSSDKNYSQVNENDKYLHIFLEDRLKLVFSESKLLSWLIKFFFYFILLFLFILLLIVMVYVVVSIFKWDSTNYIMDNNVFDIIMKVIDSKLLFILLILLVLWLFPISFIKKVEEEEKQLTRKDFILSYLKKQDSWVEKEELFKQAVEELWIKETNKQWFNRVINKLIEEWLIKEENWKLYISN